MTDTVEATTEAPVTEEAQSPAESLLGGTEAQVTTEAPDYSYVPDKFKGEDGSPDFETLAKSYTDLESQFHNGVKAKDVEEYSHEFANPDRINGEALNEFKAQALEKGLSPEQFSFMMDNFDAAVESLDSQYESQQMTPERATTALTDIWGDKAEANINVAVEALGAFMPADLDISSFENDPNVIQLLHAVGMQMKEDHAPNTAASNVQPMTETEVADLRNRPDYWTNSEVQAKVTQYYNQQNQEG